jgi:hypothetical protein
MINSYSSLYEGLYEIVFFKAKYKHSFIINKLKALKWPVEYEELTLLKKIFSNSTVNEIKEFFNEIYRFENSKFKNYEYIDYFFFKFLNPNKSIQSNMRILKKVNDNFHNFCRAIEESNDKKLCLATDLFGNSDVIINGSLATVPSRKILKIIKDIDGIKKDQELLVDKRVVTCDGKKIVVEVFSNNYPFFKFLDCSEKNLRSGQCLRVLNTESLYRLFLNADVLKRYFFMIIDLFEKTSGKSQIPFFKRITDEYDLLKDYIYTLKLFPVPFCLHYFKYFKTVLRDYGCYFLIDYFYLKKIVSQNWFSNNIFFINIFVEDLDLALKIYDLFFNKLIKGHSLRSNRSITDRQIMLFFFMNRYGKKFTLRNKSLEEKIFIIENLEALLIKAINDYKIKGFIYQKNGNDSYKF